MTSQPQREDLIDIARGAGEILRQGFGQQHDIGRKSSDIDLVTEVDLRSEKYLLEALAHRYPDRRVVSEESDGLTGSGQGAFFIDPLDGTVNYSHGLPIFCVSIGYTVSGEAQLGVIYDPMRDEVFSAELNKGAWLNDTPIQVSAASELKHSLLVSGFPYDTWTNPNNNLDNFARFMVRSQGVRRLAAAALDLCYVAAGRFDGYWELYLEAWDLAAGGLIAREAGAKVTKVDGTEYSLSEPLSVIAANPQIHAEILAVLQENEN